MNFSGIFQYLKDYLFDADFWIGWSLLAFEIIPRALLPSLLIPYNYFLIVIQLLPDCLDYLECLKLNSLNAIKRIVWQKIFISEISSVLKQIKCSIVRIIISVLLSCGMRPRAFKLPVLSIFCKKQSFRYGKL